MRMGVREGLGENGHRGKYRTICTFASNHMNKYSKNITMVRASMRSVLSHPIRACSCQLPLPTPSTVFI
jgi:hypothetical protein